jgi:hypothetical protein
VLPGPFRRRSRFLAVTPSLTVPIPTRPAILTGRRLQGRGFDSLATGSILSQPGSLTALRQLLGIPEKRRIFVSYHHARDQVSYDALARMCDECDFRTDRSVDGILDSDDASPPCSGSGCAPAS